MQPVDPSTPRFQPTHGLINGPLLHLLSDASKFLDLVREYKNGEVYDCLMQILTDYGEQGGSISRIEQLLENHNELRQGLKRLQLEAKVTDFIKKIEGRLSNNDLMRYFEILDGFLSRQKTVVKVVQEMAVLFGDHEDLFLDFCGFLPGGSNLSDHDVGGTASRIEQSEVKVTKYIKKMEDRLAINGLMRHTEILTDYYSRHKSKIKMAQEVSVLFADHEDLFAEFCEIFLI